MDNASYFFNDKALFGSFPKQDDVTQLEEYGVRFFVDLTFPDEKKIRKYSTKYKYISYPIKDRKAPFHIKGFVIFLKRILHIIHQLTTEKLYIHCRAGHSRSSLIVACLLCILKGIDVDNAISLTRHYHNQRKNLKEKWKSIAHLSNSQLKFIYKIFDNVFFFRAYKQTNITYGFSNYSTHSVRVPNVGKFINAQVAYNALKRSFDDEYVKKQMNVRSTYESNKIAKQIVISNQEKNENMKRVLLLKIEQHDDVKENLLNTAFMKLVYNNKNDFYFGFGDGTGRNVLGNILMNIRKDYTEKLI